MNKKDEKILVKQAHTVSSNLQTEIIKNLDYLCDKGMTPQSAYATLVLALGKSLNDMLDQCTPLFNTESICILIDRSIIELTNTKARILKP